MTEPEYVYQLGSFGNAYRHVLVEGNKTRCGLKIHEFVKLPANVTMGGKPKWSKSPTQEWLGCGECTLPGEPISIGISSDGELGKKLHTR